MKFYLILASCLSFITLDLFASSTSLVNEFLSKNSTVKANRYRVDIANHEYEAIYNKMPFVIAANATKANSDLDSITTATKQTVTSDVYSLKVGKDFIWGGNFELSSTLTKLDRSEMNLALLGGATPIISEYSQKLTYTQSLGTNFLGIDDRAEREMANRNFKYTVADSGKSEQAALHNFFNQCVDAQLKKTFRSLEKGAWLRSIKRKKLIRKRVRDGLREKADLLQAKMEEISKKENYESAKIELNQAIDRLSVNLHRKVIEAEIFEYNFQKYRIPARSGSYRVDDNFELSASNEKVALLKTQHIRADYSVFPTITLSGSYSTNNYNEMSSTAFSDGTFGDNKETTVGLTVSFPIGFAAQKHNRAKAYVQLQAEQYNNKTLAKNIKNSLAFINKEIDILDVNLKSAKSRRVLAFRLLREYNKLYNLGKADIDQVIRAEENLITTEKGYGSYMATREKMVANLEALKGTLSRHLLK